MSSLPLPPPSPPQSSPIETPARYTIRPWREFFDTRTLSFPTSFSETLTRVKTNGLYFKVNYSFLCLMIFSLLTFVYYHSIVTLVLISVYLVAFYRYFTASPMKVFGYTVDDQAVGPILFFTAMFCVLILPSSRRTFLVLIVILLYWVMVCFHGALKVVPNAGENPYDRLLDHGTTGPTYNTMESSL